MEDMDTFANQHKKIGVDTCPLEGDKGKHDVRLGIHWPAKPFPQELQATRATPYTALTPDKV